MAEVQKEILPGPHSYLWTLAVDPSFQGRGIGKSLLKPGLDRADEQDTPIESNKTSWRNSDVLPAEWIGKMVVIRIEESWQLATNFLVTATDGQTQGECPRFDRINQELQDKGGKLIIQDAFNLLEVASQDDSHAQSSTQWSVIYDMTGGDVHIIMGRKYAGGVHTLHLSR